MQIKTMYEIPITTIWRKTKQNKNNNSPNNLIMPSPAKDEELHWSEDTEWFSHTGKDFNSYTNHPFHC